MIIVSEKNYIYGKNNNFKVIRTEKEISDEEYQERENRKKFYLANLKRKKIALLTKAIKKSQDFINYRQMEMLTEPDNRKSLSIQEHIFSVLVPELHRYQRELRALQKKS